MARTSDIEDDIRIQGTSNRNGNERRIGSTIKQIAELKECMGEPSKSLRSARIEKSRRPLNIDSIFKYLNLIKSGQLHYY
jgi:hypothetical protein